MLLPADREPRPLALVLQVLRREPDRRHRKDLRLVADLGPPVDDDRRADAAALADADVGANDRCRPDRRSRADPGGRMHVRGRIHVRRTRLDRQQQLGFGHDLTVDVGHGPRLGQPRAACVRA